MEWAWLTTLVLEVSGVGVTQHSYWRLMEWAWLRTVVLEVNEMGVAYNSCVESYSVVGVAYNSRIEG